MPQRPDGHACAVPLPEQSGNAVLGSRCAEAGLHRPCMPWLEDATRHERHAVTLCRALTSCTVLAGQTGMPPQRASGRSTSSSVHSGRDVFGSHSDEPGLKRQRTCFVNTASGGSSFDSWRKPAQAHSARHDCVGAPHRTRGGFGLSRRVLWTCCVHQQDLPR